MKLKNLNEDHKAYIIATVITVIAAIFLYLTNK